MKLSVVKTDPFRHEKRGLPTQMQDQAAQLTEAAGCRGSSRVGRHFRRHRSRCCYTQNPYTLIPRFCTSSRPRGARTRLNNKQNDFVMMCIYLHRHCIRLLSTSICLCLHCIRLCRRFHSTSSSLPATIFIKFTHLSESVLFTSIVGCIRRYRHIRSPPLALQALTLSLPFIIISSVHFYCHLHSFY